MKTFLWCFVFWFVLYAGLLLLSERAIAGWRVGSVDTSEPTIKWWCE